MLIGAIGWLAWIIFLPDVPRGPQYDCDDSTLSMYHHFKRIEGLECYPIVGNLEKTGESFEECDHIWLIVLFGEKKVAYDWGVPQFDLQHYEGWRVNEELLLKAVEHDVRQPP